MSPTRSERVAVTADQCTSIVAPGDLHVEDRRAVEGLERPDPQARAVNGGGL